MKQRSNEPAASSASANSSESIRIGALARSTGCSIATIRYYEEVGLIPPASRRSSGHRVYDPKAIERLAFVRRCRDFGFTIEQTRALLTLSQEKGRDCVELRAIAEEHLKAVRGNVLKLMTLERSLARFAETCTATCAGGPAPECSILRDLGLEEPDRGTRGCCG